MKLPNQLLLQDPTEIVRAHDLHTLIQSTNFDGAPIYKSLTHLDLNTLFRLTTMHADIENFCRHATDTQLYWAQTHLNNAYPTMMIPTCDGYMITIYDLLMGAILYSQCLIEPRNSNLKSL